MFPCNRIGNRTRSMRGFVGWGAVLLIWSLLNPLPILCAVCAGAGVDLPQDEERLEQFLARMGLVDLQIQLLERTLRSAEPPAAEPAADKQPRARRLADLYAERLMASTEDPAKYAETLQRIEALVRDFPAAHTTALEVMLLQADYNRAESLVSAWITDPQATASRTEAQQILARITPLLVQHDEALTLQTETLLAQLDEMPEGDMLQRHELEVKRVQGMAARAGYFAAWANYYLGVVTNAPLSADPYVKARDIFRRLFGFDDTVPSQADAQWLGLETIWRARALIGLGLSEAACGDLAACDRCFQLIEHASVPPEIKDQAPYWYLRALLTSGQNAPAEAYARQQVEQMQPPATQGQVSFCVALIREGFAPPDAGSISAPDRKLGQLGLTGLARLDQLGALNTLIDKYQLQADNEAGFVLLWAAGQRQFALAETSRAAADYQAAARLLQSALRAPEANTLAGPASRCRYTLAWCHYRQDEFETAAREFTTALTGLEAVRDPLAVESAWMAFACYRHLVESQPRWLTAATDALKRVQRSFPDHVYATRAKYELAKLMDKNDPEALASQLESVPESDAHYAQARYDLCVLRHRLWSQQRSEVPAGRTRLTALQDAANGFLRTAQAEANPAQAVKCCLLVADAALHNVEPQLDRAQKILDQVAPAVARLPAADPLAAEYHYRLLELATAQGNAEERRRHAQWLTDQAADSPYELAALLTVANAIDRDAAQAGAENNTDLHQRAYAIYQRVVTLLEKSATPLSESKNLQVAYSRLAHYATRLGKPAEAAERLEQLLKENPQDRRLLRRAGQAHAAAGQHEKALAHWRTLLLGLPKGTDDWFEAKFFQLQSLGHTDKDQARKVLHQFQLLYPELGGPAWRDKFHQLSRNW
ncbi:MAG: tetratricopeptide repeat protein [Pirellulaceae bacterium]